MFRGLKKALLIVTISATLGGGFGIILPSTLSGDATPTAQAATTPKYYVAKVKKSKVVYQINVKKNTIKK